MYYHLLIILGFGRGVGINQHRIVVQHAFVELIGHHEQIDDIFDGGVLDEDRGFEIRPHIAIEDKIDLGGA